MRDPAYSVQRAASGQGTLSLPVSAHVLTYNSEKTLRRCLDSLLGCQEILVIDGGSTDDTLQIAGEFGAVVLPQRENGMAGPASDFATVRNRGLVAATQPWILALDSDEYLEKGFLEEIADVIGGAHPETAYRVPRKYVLDDGTIVHHASTYPNERVYFFRKDAVIVWEKPVHERVQLRPGAKVGKLDHGSLAPLGSIRDFRKKNERYLQIEVERAAGEGWPAWIRRALRSLRAQAVSMGRLAWIWIIPRQGKRLPLKHEWERWRYRWRLVWETRPRAK